MIPLGLSVKENDHSGTTQWQGVNPVQFVCGTNDARGITLHHESTPARKAMRHRIRFAESVLAADVLIYDHVRSKI